MPVDETNGHMVRNEHGVAFLMVMILMLILTVLGIAAMTVTGLENRIAGFQRTTEVAADAAESCLSSSVKIIQQTIENGSVPAAVVSSSGPVPTGAETAANPSLSMEINGQADNHADTVTGSGASGPDYSQTINGYTVRGDIDRLYLQAKAGSGMQFAAGYEGAGSGSAGGGVDVLYRVDCRATLAATGTESRIVGVYACTLTGETCQRKL
ncbi:putative Type IV pilus assembly protein PilX [Nitrospira japonica]|uniref:Putative Type IV pilus assembly protein PilX n=1 Tax=Nitrospira japonica TaxID=1325564 RepID=A0A1W1I206_9BACT|nr:PilX N-terminal domain-containing pilus assembly protein [Nitrospira japonica]SLM46899.1 putative Type IV pilus assembly protein PilX [Nitrospira japonica]